MTNVSQLIAASGGAAYTRNKKAYVSMLRFLEKRIYFIASRALDHKKHGNQTAFFDTGPEAADHYASAHALAKAFDPELAQHMQAVETAADTLSDAQVALHTLISLHRKYYP